MKNRYRLIRYRQCNGIYYLHDKVTGQRESLHTNDKQRANELMVAKNETAREPAFNLQKARVNLAASDPGVATRTWRSARDAMIESKPAGSVNRHRWKTFANDKALEPILDKLLLETPRKHILQVVQAGTVSTKGFHAPAPQFLCRNELAPLANSGQETLASGQI